MPIIGGSIGAEGALVDVLVGVSANRRAALLRVGLPAPPDVPLRLQIDTGSFATAFPAAVFASLQLNSYRTVPVRTSSTTPGQPHYTDQFDISLTLVSGLTPYTIPSVHAISSEDFDADVQGLVGRDVLDRCVFNYYGPHRQFILAF